MMLLMVAVIPPPTDDSTQLVFMGDIMLGRGVAQAHSDGSWDEALAPLAPYTTTADLAFANLESPITAAPLIRETYDLRSPNQTILTLSTSGMDLVSLANNHMGDSGPSGIVDTIRALNTAGITPVGPDETPIITQRRGLSIAWFAFNDTLQPLEENTVQEALASARDRVDLIIVSIHWGSEGASVPDNRQRSLAQLFADVGADIIIGHHPHILQPAEWMWGKGRNRPTLVAFSLGNALFDQAAPPGARYCALLKIAIHRLGVQDVCVIPFQIDPRTWNTSAASPTTAEAVLKAIQLGLCQGVPLKENPSTLQ